jgi:hypothetical protein
MNIVERAKKIIIKPKETWEEISKEKADVKTILTTYIIPLSLIPALSYIIGYSLIGLRVPYGEYVRIPLTSSLLTGVVTLIFNILGVFISAFVIKTISGYFSADTDFTNSFKLVAYSSTPVFLASIFNIIPALSVLSILGLYGIYLLFLGIPALIPNLPEDKRINFTIVVIIATIIVSIVVNVLIGQFIWGPIYSEIFSY